MDMDIVVGSHNKTKVKAVEAVFPGVTVIAEDVPSGISSQPLGDKETRKGAVNRAILAQKSSFASAGIGLEGGVMRVSGRLYLCNWGALQSSEGTLYTAAGARIELPDEFTNKLEKGMELSDIMNAYTEKADIRNHEGAIGIFTDGFIDRSEMFIHTVHLLKGQLSYWNKKGS